MLKGIVFDLDGTLIDSPLCFKTIRKQLGVPEGEYILEHLARLPSDAMVPKLRELEEIEFAAAAKAILFPGVLRLLLELQNSKIPIGIFTRNCRRATEHVINSFGLPVGKVVTREDAPPKPDPAGLKVFLELWQVMPNDLLYVGDFRFDIECGKKAGVKTALFTNGRELQENWGSDYLISDYSEFWSSVRPRQGFESHL